MNDLISRQDAINAMMALKHEDDERYGCEIPEGFDGQRAVEALEKLPSAEPERKRKFLKIVVEYPEICTYPEFKGKPYYSIMYEENGETIVGFGTYKPEVLSQYLREYFLPSAESERNWTPVTEALPDSNDDVLLQFRNNMAVGYYEDDGWSIATGEDLYSGVDESEDKPIAWKPLPEPYGGE